MHDKHKKTSGWKQKFADEMAEYFADVLYLFLLLGMFTLYKRLLLAQYQISYLHYGITLIEALILAKILVIGRLLRLDRPLASRPLIFPTIWKALIFALLVGGFTVIEAVIRGWVHGHSAIDALGEFAGRGSYDLIGKMPGQLFRTHPVLRPQGGGLGSGKG